jgi:8-amino-7-oxononanoate synthase
MYLLRCSLCADHSTAQVAQILAMFEAAGKATGVLG